MILYTTHCPSCRMVKQMLDSKNIPYTIVDDIDKVLAVADENGIRTAPFVEYDGKFYTVSNISELINNHMEKGEIK